MHPVAAYNAAQRILCDVTVTETDLHAFVQELPKRWQNRHFQRYGLFISTIADQLLQESMSVVVPLRCIDEYVLREKGKHWFEEFGHEVALNYLGFRQRKGKLAIYDGNAGYAFGYKAQGDLILTGSAQDRAGWKQGWGQLKKEKKSKIVIFMNVKSNANESQHYGRMVIGGNAGNDLNKNKRGGDTYVLGSIKRSGGLNMEGGRLFVVKNAGAHYGEGLKGQAEIFIGGNAGPFRVRERAGGVIHLRPLIIDDATDLYNWAGSELHPRKIPPCYDWRDYLRKRS